MRLPLIRQGEGPAGLVRLHEQRLHDLHLLNKMIDTANATPSQQDSRRRGIIGARSAGGDEQRLRGIPAIGRNVAGAIPGTVPG